MNAFAQKQQVLRQFSGHQTKRSTAEETFSLGVKVKVFLINLFKNFEEQGEDFFNVIATVQQKYSAIQLKSNEAINLKYFNVLNVAVVP